MVFLSVYQKKSGYIHQLLSACLNFNVVINKHVWSHARYAFVSAALLGSHLLLIICKIIIDMAYKSL